MLIPRENVSQEENTDKYLSITENIISVLENRSRCVLNESDWGPKRDPLYIVVPMTFLYSTIFFSGLIGNVSTCIVIYYNKFMHTATNYYLFSLAISDLLLLLSALPPEIYSIWSRYPYIFGEVFCIIQGFCAETSTNASILTITAFTVERYLAICHPFLSHTMSKLSRAVKFIILVWVLAISLALPQALSYGIYYDEKCPQEQHVCIMKNLIIPHSFEVSTFLFFLTPMVMITVLYVLIGIQLRQSSVSAKNESFRMNYIQKSFATTVILHDKTPNVEVDGSQRLLPRNKSLRISRRSPSRGKRRVIKMLVAVVVAFFICWAPFHAQRLLAIYGKAEDGEKASDMMNSLYKTMTYMSGIFFFLSTTINPVLYHIMSHKFRKAFIMIIKKIR